MELVHRTDPILTKKARKVKPTGELNTMAQAFFDFINSNNGVGLAAPQVGMPIAMCVIEWEGKRYVLYNPKVVRRSKEWTLAEEGCLSIPGFVGYVPRWKEVTVEYTNYRGTVVRLKAKDHLARILQHEIDHLNGKLYTDLTNAVIPEEKNV